jgi:hypothetical protein
MQLHDPTKSAAMRGLSPDCTLVAMAHTGCVISCREIDFQSWAGPRASLYVPQDR